MNSNGIGKVFTTLGASNHADHDRQDHDYYATEPSCVDDLVKILGTQMSGRVWEPACGELHISNRLKELIPGIEIKNSDIIDRNIGCEIIDFLKYDGENSFDGDIVTNPPYKYAQEFVENSMKSITDGHYVCMFLKITFLEGQKRRKMFDKYPPLAVHVYSKRKSCAIGGDFDKSGGAICYAWYVWKKGWHGSTELKWI